MFNADTLSIGAIIIGWFVGAGIVAGTLLFIGLSHNATSKILKKFFNI